MSRLRRFVHSVASGYALLGAIAVYALASLPLALHYLSKERFGLWTLMASIGGYLSLIDLGMSSSLARLLIDHKDKPEEGHYGSLIKTGWLVLALQGVIVLVLGMALAPAIGQLLAIPAELRAEFTALLRWQCAVLGLGFGLRIFSQLLQAHQRMDLVNYSQIATLVMNFALLWVFFDARKGVFSLVWSALISSLGGALFLAMACLRLKLFPKTGGWGQASWREFRTIFDYGKDLFLVAIGIQIIMASQTMIITRRLGLEAAAAWFAGTRTFNLISQAVYRISDMAMPAFSEMMARGERLLLRERYKGVLILTASVSGFAAVGYALCNSLFVTVWMHNKISWPPANDVLLGGWLMVMAPVHCHNVFLLLTKKLGFIRYIFFIEGIVFVTASLLTAQRGGLPAIILCSLVCNTVFSGAYGVWRISRYFELPVREVAFGWLMPMGRVLCLFVPVALVVWWCFQSIEEPILRLALNATIGGSFGFYVLLRYGLSESFQRELIERAPKGFNPLLRRVFPASAH